jgi:hypothetical protein
VLTSILEERSTLVSADDKASSHKDFPFPESFPKMLLSLTHVVRSD